MLWALWEGRCVFEMVGADIDNTGGEARPGLIMTGCEEPIPMEPSACIFSRLSFVCRSITQVVDPVLHFAIVTPLATMLFVNIRIARACVF